MKPLLLPLTLPTLISPGCKVPENASRAFSGGPGVRASLVAHTVKNPPAMWETWVQSLGWEDKNFKEGGNGTIRLLKKQLDIMKKV